MNSMPNEEISHSLRSQILQVSEYQTVSADFEAQSHSEGLSQCRAHTSETAKLLVQAALRESLRLA
jgi:hypothetical protein